jgi:hypothetical protein
MKQREAVVETIRASDGFALARFRNDPESKSLHDDPRYAALMRKIGFTEP